jgi:hypothetical protein
LAARRRLSELVFARQLPFVKARNEPAAATKIRWLGVTPMARRRWPNPANIPDALSGSSRIQLDSSVHGLDLPDPACHAS